MGDYSIDSSSHSAYCDTLSSTSSSNNSSSSSLESVDGRKEPTKSATTHCSALSLSSSSSEDIQAVATSIAATRRKNKQKQRPTRTLSSDLRKMAIQGSIVKRPLVRQGSLLGDEFNTKSLLCSMSSFVDAVDKMDKTVMLPSKLLDCNPNMPIQPDDCANGLESKFGSNAKNGGNSGLNGKNCKGGELSVAQATDLYSLYSLLKSLKHELVQGEPKNDETNGDDFLDIDCSEDNSIGDGFSDGYFYCEESDDERSANSLDSVDEDGDFLRLKMSTPTPPASPSADNEAAHKVKEAFRFHMNEMQKILAQLTSGAEHLELLYTNDMKNTVPVDKFGVKLDSNRLPNDVSSSNLMSLV